MGDPKTIADLAAVAAKRGGASLLAWRLILADYVAACAASNRAPQPPPRAKALRPRAPKGCGT